MFWVSRKEADRQVQNLVGVYEAHIKTLEHQIADLRKLVFSSTSSTIIPAVQLEQDAILSQKDEVIELSQEEIAELQEVESEANRILSGTY